MSGDVVFNTNGKCAFCSGTVGNIDGRRKTRENLSEVHQRTCPGIPSTRKANA